MKRKGRTDLLLLLLTLCFLGGALALKNSMPETAGDPPEKVYYLTGYEDSSQLLAVQVSNVTGTLTMVHNKESYITDTQMPGIKADETAVSALFEAVYRIRVGDPVDGADPADPQFGLEEPSARILIEDTKESGIQFLIGALTPDESAYYICTEGGGDVYTLPVRYSEYFLQDIRKYLDLRVFTHVDPAQVRSITVSDGEGVRYALAADGSSTVTGAAYYSLTRPADLPVPLSRMNEEVFASMDGIRAVNVLSGTDSAEQTAGWSEAVIETEDLKTYRFRAGRAEDGRLYILDFAADRTLEVTGFPEWMQTDAAGLLGGKLLSLSAPALESIELVSAEGSAGFDFDETHLWPELITKLNQITIESLQPEDDRTDTGEEVLRCTIHRKGGEENLELVFSRTKNRKCRIRINGKTAFLCALSSISPIISESAGTL